MDHRCLYGHRVPATFAYAIQNRLCPMCGASTVTVTGYQVARKLTQEAGMDAHAAFQAVKVIEADWIFQPVTANVEAAPAAVSLPAATPAAAAIPAAASLPAASIPAAASLPAPVEEVVMEPLDAEEPRAARPAPVANLSVAAVALTPVSSTPVSITPRVKPTTIVKPEPDTGLEDDFFKNS